MPLIDPEGEEQAARARAARTVAVRVSVVRSCNMRVNPIVRRKIAFKVNLMSAGI